MIGSCKITTSEGMMEIQKLAEMSETTLKKYKVMHYEGKFEIPQPIKINSVYEVSTKRPICKLHLDGGPPITCDSETKFFNGENWICAEKMLGEKVLYYHKKNLFLNVIFVEKKEPETVFLLETENKLSFISNYLIVDNSNFFDYKSK